MIILHLFGGIGNQMFQYAHGRALSLITSKKLVLDTSSLNSHYPWVTKREYSLNIFKLKPTFVNRYSDNIALNKLKIIKEAYPFKYDSTIISQAVGSVELMGTWQSWKYFINVNGLILNDFSFNEEYVPNENLDMIEKLKNSNSVSIHIRRTDYLSPHNKFLGVLPMKYYQNAIEYISKRVYNPIFYIFSDDADWVKSNIHLSYESYVIEGNSPNVDLYLMSNCKHNIIANSTFSWWAAWLNANSEKIIIAPQLWFLEKKINVSELDIIPQEWITLNLE